MIKSDSSSPDQDEIRQTGFRIKVSLLNDFMDKCRRERGSPMSPILVELVEGFTYGATKEKDREKPQGSTLDSNEEKWVSKLLIILRSGHRVAIDAVTKNLDAFSLLVSVDTQYDRPRTKKSPNSGRERTSQ